MSIKVIAAMNRLLGEDEEDPGYGRWERTEILVVNGTRAKVVALFAVYQMTPPPLMDYLLLEASVWVWRDTCGWVEVVRGWQDVMPVKTAKESEAVAAVQKWAAELVNQVAGGA
jgi:hypothetical protein